MAPEPSSSTEPTWQSETPPEDDGLVLAPLPRELRPELQSWVAPPAGDYSLGDNGWPLGPPWDTLPPRSKTIGMYKKLLELGPDEHQSS